MRPILELEELGRRRRRMLRSMRFVTTPTSMVNRLMGLEACTDGLLLGDGTTVGGTGANASVIVIPPATTTLTLTAAAHGNRRLNIASTAGLAITPPAATGSGIAYTFFVSATLTGGSFTFDAKAGNASDLIAGIAFQNKTGTGLTTTPTAATTNLLTLNGTTTGGILGDLIQLIDVGTHAWNLLIIGQYTGTFATPFSNH